MTINKFFELFAENNPDIPEGTDVTVTHDYMTDQMIVTYMLDGNPVKHIYNVEYVGGEPKFEEVVKNEQERLRPER